MHKLLSADLRRLWINKSFWRTAIIMACAEGAFYLFFLGQGPMAMDLILFISLQGIGILTSVFFSLFLGTEYNDGTIRNKLIVGHKRSHVYLASFITGIIAITIIYLAGILTGGIIGILLYAPPVHSIGEIMLAVVIGWLACVSYIAIFNFVGMLSSSQAKTSIICILTAFILMFAGLILYSIAGQGFLTGFPKVICQFLYEFNPFGQTVQNMSIDIASPWKLSAYSLILSFVLTGIGVYVFNKKDLK